MSVRWCPAVVATLLLLPVASAPAHAQTTATFVAMGSDPGDPLFDGQEVYFDSATADISANRTSGVGRNFVTIIVRPKDQSPFWSFSFATSEHAAGFIGQLFVATAQGGWNSGSIGINAGDRSCGAMIGWFVVREITAAPPGFEAAVDFEARCPGASAGAYGRIRVRSRFLGASIGDLIVPASPPIAPGTTLTFRVMAEASVPLEFKFLKLSRATQTWTVVQDYSFRPAWTWTPTVGDLGDYSLQVWIRTRGSTQPFDDWRASSAFTIAIAPAQVLAVQSDVPLPAPAGTIITWTATASGGSLPLEYEFVRYAPGLGRWLTVRTWDASPVWEQRTTPLDEGVNTVIVAVRSRGSAEMEASETRTFELGPPPATYVLASREDATGLLHAQATFYPDRLGSVVANVTNGLHVAASNALPHSFTEVDLADDGQAPAPGLYDDVQVRPDAVPGAATSFLATGTTATCAMLLGRYRILEMTSDASGLHVAADVQQQCSGAAETDYAAVRINSSVPLVNVLSLTSNVTSIVGPGAHVTWRADASSGAGPLEYRFIRYSVSADAWTIVRDWDRNSQFQWQVGAADTGAYYLQVWVRTVGSLVSYQAWKGDGPFTVASVPVGVFGLRVNDARPRAGQPVTIEAVAGGGSGEVEYRFVKYSYVTGQWSTIQEYGPSNVAQWTPPVGESGEYALQVWVRERGSTSAYDAWQGLSMELDPARLLVLSSQAGDPVGGGRSTLTLPARVSGATINWLGVAAADDLGVWTALLANGGMPWQVGMTTMATSDGGPGVSTLSVRHSATDCGSSAGHLTIHEAVLNRDGALEKAAIDFDQVCNGAAGPLYGGLRLNSDVPLVHALSVVPSTATPAAGVQVTLTGTGSAATGPVEFRFLLFNAQTSQWTLLREYGRENTASWTPPAPGVYTVQLWIRRVGVAAAYESYVSSASIVVR
jgi:hypothetical protein